MDVSLGAITCTRVKGLRERVISEASGASTGTTCGARSDYKDFSFSSLDAVFLEPGCSPMFDSLCLSPFLEAAQQTNQSLVEWVMFLNATGVALC